MSSQLEQLVGYLEREGVTELVVRIGRPIAMRTAAGITNLTAKPLTSEQLSTLVRGTEISIPTMDTVGTLVEVQVGRRRVCVQVGRRGDEVLMRLTRSNAQPLATQPIARVAAPSPEPPRDQPRSRSDSQVDAREQPRSRSDSQVEARESLASPTPKTGTLRAGVATPQPTLPRSKRTSALDLPGPPIATFEVDDFDMPALELEPPRESLAAAARMATATAVMDSIDLGPGDIDLAAQLTTEPLTRGVPAPASAPVPPRAAPAAPAPARAAPAASAPARAPAASAAAQATAATPPPPRFATAGKPTFGELVRFARERGASDLHVSATRVTSIRAGGDLVPIDPDASALADSEAEALLLPLLDEAARDQLDKIGYVDFALAAPDGGRLRANICRQQGGLKGTFRLALAAPATLDQLGLPSDLAKVVAHHQGLVVIAGPSGHGKTTTLAALVDLINSSKPYHILTIEDPIEIVHGRKQAVITQREAGRHTESFARGLKASLREDPDVIVIGELRDRESVEIALTAAETGHLVIATMSTPSAAKTIDRLIDMFPPEEHSQVRASVAGALRAIVAQRLLPGREGGVVPAIELVTGVLPLAVMIREDKLYQLPNLMQRGRAFGMIRFDESLMELARTGRITEEVALQFAESKKELAAQMQTKTTPLYKVGKW